MLILGWAGKLREVHFGDPILAGWGDFSGGMSMAKVDLLGRSDSYDLRPERPFAGVSGPSGHKIAETLKKSLFGGLQKGLRKHPIKSKNALKSPVSGLFGDFYIQTPKMGDLKSPLFGIPPFQESTPRKIQLAKFVTAVAASESFCLSAWTEDCDALVDGAAFIGGPFFCPMDSARVGKRKLTPSKI